MYQKAAIRFNWQPILVERFEEENLFEAMLLLLVDQHFQGSHKRCLYNYYNSNVIWDAETAVHGVLL